jgi:hypothetical protein
MTSPLMMRERCIALQSQLDAANNELVALRARSLEMTLSDLSSIQHAMAAHAAVIRCRQYPAGYESLMEADLRYAAQLEDLGRRAKEAIDKRTAPLPR